MYATGSELSESSRTHVTRGAALFKTHNARSAFELVLAKRVGNKRVLDVMTASEVRQLAEEYELEETD